MITEHGALTSTEYIRPALSDLGSWTDHGVSFASRKGEGYIWNGEDSNGIGWKDAMLYAPDVLCIEGKYWLVSCLSGGGLGMSVSDVPEGPFSPAARIVYDNDGEPLGSIDPALYEEDGKVYLIWGQRASFGAEGLVGVELMKDGNGMYAVAKRETKSYLFGDEENPDQGFGFYEGPSIRKIRDKYYVLYPSDKGKGVHMMSYATADHPLGPYTFRGNILDNDGCDLESGNDHGSLCEVNGKWYIFYHRGFGNSNMRRKVCVEEIRIEEDGTIRQVEMTNHGFAGAQSPYDRVEAASATHVRMNGFKAGCYFAEYSKEYHPLIHITDGNCVEYRDFDFGDGGQQMAFEAEIAPLNGGEIEIVVDKPEGEAIGMLRVEAAETPEAEGVLMAEASGKLHVNAIHNKQWYRKVTQVTMITGIHTLYFRFKSKHNNEICELSSFRFVIF